MPENSPSVCPGCGRPELHIRCPAHGTPYYMSGKVFTKEMEWMYEHLLGQEVSVTTRLYDTAGGKSVPGPVAHITPNKHYITIGVAGYGEKTAISGEGSQMLLEFHEGRLRLLVWSDINQEDPTHVIDLEGARESNRKGKEDAYIQARVDGGSPQETPTGIDQGLGRGGDRSPAKGGTQP